MEEHLQAGMGTHSCKWRVSCLHVCRLSAEQHVWGGVQPLLFVSGVMFVIGAALQAGAVETGMLIVGRVVLGVGVGIASLVSAHPLPAVTHVKACWQLFDDTPPATFLHIKLQFTWRLEGGDAFLLYPCFKPF